MIAQHHHIEGRAREFHGPHGIWTVPHNVAQADKLLCALRARVVQSPL